MNRYISILCFSLLFHITQLKAESAIDINSKEIMVLETSEPVNISSGIPEHPVKEQTTKEQAVQTSSGFWLLHAEEWELTRTGESLLSLPVLKSLIKTWLQDNTKMIEIQYPGGEEGEFWVHELADWMVSLAIPSDHMIFVASSGSADVIKFELVK